MQALKRDNELRKLAQKAEEESLEQPKNPISSMTETDRSSDILHPVRWVQKFIQVFDCVCVSVLSLNCLNLSRNHPSLAFIVNFHWLLFFLISGPVFIEAWTQLLSQKLHFVWLNSRQM